MRRIGSALGLLLVATALGAQEPTPLPVGSTAPDFALGGATQNGVLSSPVRLVDLRDQTVVIAFFYRARTKG